MPILNGQFAWILGAGGLGLLVAQATGQPTAEQIGNLGLGLAGGSAIGAAVAPIIYALGKSFWDPYLVSRGWKEKFEREQTERIAVKEKLEVAVKELELARIDARADRQRITNLEQHVHTIDERSLLVSEQALVAMGRLTPGSLTSAPPLTIDDCAEEPAGPHVLVVEDMPAARKLVCAILERFGYRVHGVATLAEAMAALDTDRPDFVILDLMLPDGDGVELLKRVRDQNMKAKVIVTTGRSKALLDPVRALGPAALIGKPVDFFNELLPALRGTPIVRI